MLELIEENVEMFFYAIAIIGSTIANVIFTIKSKPKSAEKAKAEREKAITKLQAKIKKEVTKVEEKTKELESLKKEGEKNA